VIDRLSTSCFLGFENGWEESVELKGIKLLVSDEGRFDGLVCCKFFFISLVNLCLVNYTMSQKNRTPKFFLPFSQQPFGILI